MSLVADIYGLTVKETLALTDAEADFMLAKAQTTMMTLAVTSPAMQELLRSRLAPTVKAVREARLGRSEPTTPAPGPIGPPPE